MRKILIAMCLCTSFVHAQFEDVTAVAGDLIFLTEKYISPAATASVYQASGGWYTNFTPKKKFDVEISLQYNLLFIPNKYKTFLISESELQNLHVQGSTAATEIPTALGGDQVVVLEGTIGGDTFEFDAPEGIDQNSVKHGQIQVAVGLWKHTNLIARFSPNIQINDTDYSSFGIGLSHGLNQWIKPLKESSYHLGVLVTYTNYSIEDEFSEADLILGTINGIKVDGESYGFNLVASKSSVKQFDFSTALGFASTKFEYQVVGTGDFLLESLNIALEELDKSQTTFKADFNVNYRIKDFSINAMLTVGKFANLNIGVNYNIN